MSDGTAPAELWRDALVAADLLAIDPANLAGACLRSGPGLARDVWLARVKSGLAEGSPWLKAGVATDVAQLVGGLNLEASLASGRPVAERGLLARSHGGALVLSMAERLPAAQAAIIVAALDAGVVRGERDGLRLHDPARFAAIALDEGASLDEGAPIKLTDRLAFLINLGALSHRDVQATDAEATPSRIAALVAARALLPLVEASTEVLHAMTATAQSLGIISLRAPLLALRVARVAAALAGRSEVTNEDATLAARLVLGPRAIQMPAASEDQDESEPPPPEGQDNPADQPPPDPDDIRKLDDVVLDAAIAAIPKDLLSRIRMGATRRQSTTPAQGAGDSRASLRHGRPIGSRRGHPRDGVRLDLLATLRAAAPWQRLRRRDIPHSQNLLSFRRDDFRIRRFKERQQAVTVFVVDASGSTALDRLAEAKGAIELLLADCYVRRDEVALIAFRGDGAEVLLPPTRSLQRAKRELAQLPGGGGTPLAAGLIAAGRLAEDLKRKGRTPTLVIITDGRANVTSAGTSGRAQAQAEAANAAKALKARSVRAMVIDNAARPEPKAKALADEIGGLYLALPRANAAMISEVAKAQAGEIWSSRR